MSSKKDYEPQYEYKENKYYKLYEKEKQVIKDKYPEEIFVEPIKGRCTIREGKEYIQSGQQELHRQYLKELADLIFTPDGNYQKFTWDIIGDAEKLEMDRRARGSKYGGTGEYRY